MLIGLLLIGVGTAIGELGVAISLNTIDFQTYYYPQFDVCPIDDHLTYGIQN